MTAPRFCYQVHTHTQPALVERLVRRLVEAGTDPVVLVSHDVRAEPLPVRTLERLGDVHVLGARGGYGDLSHVDRWIDATRWLDAHGVAYDWMVTLSGQDYPVRPVAEGEREVAAAAYDGYLEHFPVFSEESRWPPHRARNRYLYRHRRLPALPAPVRAMLRPARAVNAVQPFFRVNAMYGSFGVRTPTPLGPGFALWGGSFFTTLNRRCVAHVRDFYESRPAVMRWFRGVLAPEEVFFQTVLVAADRFHLSADPLRYFDFAHGDGAHPRPLTLADVPALRASGAHWARKFDQSTSATALDALDAHPLVVASE